MSRLLVSPAQVCETVAARYRTNHKRWLVGEGEWPLTLGLGCPTGAVAIQDVPAVRSWVEAWQGWRGTGAVEFESRRWQSLGEQRVPVTVRFDSPTDVADVVNEGERWRLARRRQAELVARWPSLTLLIGRFFDCLSLYEEQDWERLVRMLEWLTANPDSCLYLRQIPVRGLHTKWLEQRLSVVSGLLAAITGRTEADVYAMTGLKRPPDQIRLVLLDPELRSQLGGIRDPAVSADDASRLALGAQRVLMLENLQTALGLPDVPGTVAICRRGNAVGVLRELPWIPREEAYYWGDIDSYGFAILSRARLAVPGLRSVMMDEAVIDAHRDLVNLGQDDGRGAPSIEALTAAERGTLDSLLAGRWGDKAQLEQERVGWNYAMSRLSEACGVMFAS